MNKQKFIELLVSTEKVTETDLSALEQMARQYPFFQSGHSVLAKVSRKLKSGSTPKKLATAAIYSTNRNLFKQYMSSGIKAAAPTKSLQDKTIKERPSNIGSINKAPELLSNDEQDELIQDLYKNLDQWKSSRDQYLEYDKNHPEEIVIEEVTKENNSVEALKSQVAKEVEAEDETPDQNSVQEDEKSNAALLDEIKIQVAKEALKEEVEELEKELKESKTPSSELKEPEPPTIEPLEDPKEQDTTQDTASGSVYSFNKPIPEPEALPDFSDDELLNQHQEEEITNATSDEKNIESSPYSQEEVDEESDIAPNNETEATLEAKSESLDERGLPEIEELDEANEGLISSEELSAIVDQISDKVEKASSEEEIIVEDFTEDIPSDIELEVENMNASVETIEEPDEKENEIEEVNNNASDTDKETVEKVEEHQEETIEEIEDDDGGLTQKVNLDDVKKLDPDEVFDADFSDENIDFGNNTNVQETNTDPPKETVVSKADSLDTLSTEELESFEIEPNLEDISIEPEKKSDNTKSEKELGDINKEKGDLRLLPGASKGEKKFRLSVMKRPHNFTKAKKVLNARETREAQNKEEELKRKKESESKAKVESQTKKSPETKEKTPTAQKASSTKSKEEKPKKAATKKSSSKSKVEKKPKASTTKKTTTKPKENKESKESDTKSAKKKTAVSKKKEDSLDHKSIIDSFIEANPSIKVNKSAPTDVENTIDLSSESIEFPQELITENLATILKDQGKIERAIEIYEKLILNNPKKKAYFASQIENLKKN